MLGYAETATALGHCVAESLAADYLHSTRRRVPGYQPVAGFDEEHSHATRHLLLPADPGLLAGAGPLVLVDDELSTGQTVLNTIEALHRDWPAAALPDRRPGRPALGGRPGPADAHRRAGSASRSRWWRWRPGGCGWPRTRWPPASSWRARQPVAAAALGVAGPG